MPLLTLVRWTRDELLCLLTVGTIILGPIGAALAVDVVRNIRASMAGPPVHVIGRITGLTPTGEADAGVPVFLVSYEACGHTSSMHLSATPSQPLKIGMPVPVTLNAVVFNGEREEALLDVFGMHAVQPDKVYPISCPP